MRKGKYGHLVDKYPRLQEENATRGDALKLRKQELLDELSGRGTSTELAYLVGQLREKKDQLEEILSGVQLDLDAASALLIDKFEEEDINAVSLNNGRTIRIDYEITAKVEDREVFRVWCIAKGLERELRLWPSTTDSMVKEMLLNREKEPPGVKVYSRVKVVRQ